MSTDLQAFLDAWLPVQHRTGVDMHSCDATSWAEAWSPHEPVTVFGAGGEHVRNELRVTQVYRREDGVWRIVHRHGDHALPRDPDA